eukprot:GEMP01007707.1.p1 GENE.GEMP01007707.1~~GEMP01007707.1.p1  ORF type:complete len:464 (+),score=91.42 GEMP01007707.1:243-1634(+)
MYRSCCYGALILGNLFVAVADSPLDARVTVSAPADGVGASGRVLGAVREITVMAFNTFFIQLLRAPKIQARARLLSQWFRALNTSHVPDVVVFTEIWHGDFIKHLCHKDFAADNMLWGRGARSRTKCADDSPFGWVTPVANDRVFPAPISSGVIMLAKKAVELEWRSDWEYEYQSSTGVDALAHKGAQLVKVTLPDNKGVYYVVGTHTQANPEPEYALVRAKQFKELVAFVEDKVPKDQTVIVAGDFNIESNELPSMMQTLTRKSADVEPDGFTSEGFWAHNNPALNASWSTSNRFVSDQETPDRLDWVIPVAIDTNHRVTKSRAKMIYQYVPVLAAECYAVQIRHKKQYVSELSDHYAVVAHIRDEPYGAEQWTKGALVLPNPRCSTEIPSNGEVSEEGLSLLVQACLILVGFAFVIGVIGCCICPFCCFTCCSCCFIFCTRKPTSSLLGCQKPTDADNGLS